MCGISGWFLKSGRVRESEHLKAMADAMEHRGPDNRGYYIDDGRGIALAHNRLSIIDLSPSGHQPMLSADESVVLVYNGELYNFRELRKELEGLGHQFRSRSDSEVVLHAFTEWGQTCLDRFYGMFAFAVWSAHEKYLLLARDPMGIKPLYYTDLPNSQGFAFASEIKAFLALSDFKARMNRSSLQQFLEFGYTFDDHETSLKGVKKLPPGHTIEVINGCPSNPKAFFTPPLQVTNENHTLREREENLYDTLSEVISQHLIADVPVGLLLSGGIDSSVTAAFASRESQIGTICMGFADSEVDEKPYAKVVSKFIGSEHLEVTIYPNEIADILENAVWSFDDLFGDWGTISTMVLYRKCREQGIKVVLVGEGSDEIFGGYPNFRTFTQNHTRGPMIWRLFQLYQSYAGRRYGKLFPKFYSLMRSYMQDDRNDFFHAIRLFESCNQLPNNYVMKVDKASMAVSVEARVPYLDRRVVELLFHTPSNYLLVHGTNKFLLRSMAERYELLPKEITRRPKYGASMAISWMDESEQFRGYARQEILRKNGWVDDLGLRAAMTDFFEGKRQGYPFPHAISIFRNLAWRLLLLNLWSRHYLNK